MILNIKQCSVRDCPSWTRGATAQPGSIGDLKLQADLWFHRRVWVQLLSGQTRVWRSWEGCTRVQSGWNDLYDSQELLVHAPLRLGGIHRVSAPSYLRDQSQPLGSKMDKHTRAPNSEWVELRLGVSKIKVVANSLHHKFILCHIIHKARIALIFTLLVTRVPGPVGRTCPVLGVYQTVLCSASSGDF